jgi:hypothetical protein
MKKIGFLFFLSVFFTLGCRHVSQNSSNQFERVDSAGFQNSGQRELKEIYYRFPSPDEMVAILNENKPDFVPNIINSDKKSGEYLISKSQALNLGVYVADLAYLTFYGKHKESVGYLNAVYTLSDKLNISAAYDEELVNRIQNNVTNSDSLEVLADYAMTSISNYLVSNDKEETFAIISIGGFVEVMYLSLVVTNEFSPSNPVIQRIADQKATLLNLVKYTSQFNDKSARESIQMLEKIKQVYDKLEVVSTKAEVVKQSDGKLIIKGGDKLIITEEQYTELKHVVTEVRKSITQN